jgi:hypothetical protein
LIQRQDLAAMDHKAAEHAAKDNNSSNDEIHERVSRGISGTQGRYPFIGCGPRKLRSATILSKGKD